MLQCQYSGCAIVSQTASRGALILIVARSRETRVELDDGIPRAGTEPVVLMIKI
jgi:hypothetical protein